MSRISNFSRRRWLKNSIGGAAAASLPGISSLVATGAEKSDLRWEFCTFSKPLQDLSYEESSKLIAGVGFNGVEAPVRPRGHVVPEKVEDELPKLIKALKKMKAQFYSIKLLEIFVSLM